MSRVFYDHLIVFEEVETIIKQSVETSDEREELWHLIDEIIHQKLLTSIFDVLPKSYHEEFLLKFHEAPYDEKHVAYLNEKIQGDIESLLKEEVEKLKKDLLHELQGKKKKKG